MAPEVASGECDDDEIRFGDGGARIIDPAVAHADDARSGPVCAGDSVVVRFDVRFERPVTSAHIGFGCSTSEGLRVYMTTTILLGEDSIEAQAGEHRQV